VLPRIQASQEGCCAVGSVAADVLKYRIAFILRIGHFKITLACLTLNPFPAKIDHSRFNNSCLRLPASTLVDLIFQSRSFSLGGKIVQQLQYI
jgi:hypothetical protein